MFNDGAAQNFLIAGSDSSDGGITFFGLTNFGSPVSVATFRVDVAQISDDVVGIDDLLIPAATEVPEPGTFLLACAGLAFVIYAHRRLGPS